MNNRFLFSFALTTIDSLSFKYQIIKLFTLFAFHFIFCMSVHSMRIEKKEKKKNTSKACCLLPIQYIWNQIQRTDGLNKQNNFIKWNAANAVQRIQYTKMKTVLFGTVQTKQHLQQNMRNKTNGNDNFTNRKLDHELLFHYFLFIWMVRISNFEFHITCEWNEWHEKSQVTPIAPSLT